MYRGANVMTAHELLLLSISVFMVMVVMTIQGDLRDIYSPERNIPHSMGVEPRKDLREGVAIPWSFKVLNDILVIANYTAIGVIVIEDDVLFVLWIATILPAYYCSNMIIRLTEGGHLDLVTEYITYYTAITLISLSLALIHIGDIISVTALVSCSLIWGFGWQKILYGDKSQFG